MYRRRSRNRRLLARPRFSIRLPSAILLLLLGVSAIFLIRAQHYTASSEATPNSLALVPLKLPGQVSAAASVAKAETERRQLKPSKPKKLSPEISTTHASMPGDWININVAPGDNLSLIFARLALSKRELHDVLSIGEDTDQLKRIDPGQLIRFRIVDKKLKELVLELDQLNSLHVSHQDGSFTAHTKTVEPEIKLAATTMEISHSLFIDGQKAGLSDSLIMHLTEIFGWDIDFALDLRHKDRFSVIYEEIYKGKELIKQRRILAAEFSTRGKILRAILFTDKNGRSQYFSDKGEAMQKTFLRTPVNFSRISSRFNLNRKHPILNTIRAHRGVDYAAPSGTPVRATANGKIKFVGRNGGYGKAIEMQHGEVYSTLYAHLSRYARNIKQGDYATQGKIIGYVGKSGLATGPHLHYEFRVHGVHRNPLKFDLPKADPIDEEYTDQFGRRAKPLLAQLDILREQQITPSSGYMAQLDIFDSPASTNTDGPN